MKHSLIKWHSRKEKKQNEHVFCFLVFLTREGKKDNLPGKITFSASHHTFRNTVLSSIRIIVGLKLSFILTQPVVEEYPLLLSS